MFGFDFINSEALVDCADIEEDNEGYQKLPFDAFLCGGKLFMFGVYVCVFSVQIDALLYNGVGLSRRWRWADQSLHHAVMNHNYGFQHNVINCLYYTAFEYLNISYSMT